MNNDSIDILIQLALLPFTELEFYRNDIFEEVSMQLTDIPKSRVVSEIYEVNYNKDQLKYYEEHLIKPILRILSAKNRVHTLDQVTLLIEKFYNPKNLYNAYYSEKNITNLYLGILTVLSGIFVSNRNDEVVFKYWKYEKEDDILGPYKGLNKVLLWNILNRLITIDLIVSMHFIKHRMLDEVSLNNFYSTLTLSDKQLDQLLKHGVSETHMHAKAGISFINKWEQLMNLSLANTEKKYIELMSDEGLEAGKYVKPMALVRLVLADYLESLHADGHFCSNYLVHLKDNDNYGHDPSDSNLNNAQIYDLILNVHEGNELLDQSKITKMFNKFIDDRFARNNEAKPRNDILAATVFKNYKNINTLMENIFIFKALKYLDKYKRDKFFGRLFWQYVRVKNDVLHYNVEASRIKGLDNFTNYYKHSTSTPEENETRHSYWYNILKAQIYNNNLKRLELRISCINSINEAAIIRNLKPKLSAILKAYSLVLKEICIENREGTKSNNYDEEGTLNFTNMDNNSIYEDVSISDNSTSDIEYDIGCNKKCNKQSCINHLQIGIIIHFIKFNDKMNRARCWKTDSKLVNTKSLYFENLQKIYRAQSKVIVKLRSEIPGLSNYLVGIDAASIENNTDPYIFAPVFNEIREYNRKYSVKHLDNKTRELGFTYHVGEDFRHILSGLRKIDEVIEHFNYLAGDRIGHGIALGVDIDYWVRNNDVVILTRIEHMENLLWLWGNYKDSKSATTLDKNQIEKMILKEAREIYSSLDGITIYSLWKQYDDKFNQFNIFDEKFRYLSAKDQGELDKAKDIISNFCKKNNINKSIVWNEKSLEYSQYCGCFLEKMLEPIFIETKQIDSQVFKDMQRYIATKISNKGIVVETNPTSNATIGEIENIFSHYMYDLNRLQMNEDGENKKNIILTINSDDPSVFNTNASNEFAYIFYSLVEKGYSREDVLTWINKIREYGMMSSFIEDRPLTIREHIGEINGILEELK